MTSKKMMLVLIATFAFAAFASAAIEKDVITVDAINALTKSNKYPSEVIRALSNTKTVVPNSFLADAFVKIPKFNTPKTKPKYSGGCGESCAHSGCFTKVFGCRCKGGACSK